MSGRSREVVVVKKYCRNPVPGYSDSEMIQEAKNNCPELEFALVNSHYCIISNENTRDVISTACAEIRQDKIKLFQNFFLDLLHNLVVWV